MSITKKKTWGYLFLLIPAVICVLLNKYIICSWISVALLFILYCKLAFNKFSFLVKYFPLIFSSVLFIAGVIFCEFTHIELYEIDQTAGFEGSIPVVILFYLAFFLSLLIFDKPIKNISKSQFLNRLNQKKYSYLNHYIAIISSAVLFLMFVRIARYPAFLMGIDRFTYASIYGKNYGIWRIFESISYALIVFPLLDLINGHKLTGLFGLLCYVLFYLWNGNKFGPFYTLLVVYFIVDYERYVFINKRKIWVFIFTIAMIAVLLAGVAAIIQSRVMDTSIVDYISKRASQQGQLWWATYLNSDRMHITEFADELNGMLHGSSNVADNVNANYGIYKIMYYCGNPVYISNKLKAGSRFTEAGFAAAYYYMKVLGGLLFAFINALIMSRTVNALVLALKRGSIVLIAVLIRLYTIERISFSMFLFNDYMDMISIASYIAIVLFAILRKVKHHEN